MRRANQGLDLHSVLNKSPKFRNVVLLFYTIAAGNASILQDLSHLSHSHLAVVRILRQVEFLAALHASCILSLRQTSQGVGT